MEGGSTRWHPGHCRNSGPRSNLRYWMESHHYWAPKDPYEEWCQASERPNLYSSPSMGHCFPSNLMEKRKLAITPWNSILLSERTREAQQGLSAGPLPRSPPEEH